jgi:hypothetical protein
MDRVSAEKGLALNEESASTPMIKQPTQPGEQRSTAGRTAGRTT